MPQGFIHDELDIKLLILYIMSRVAEPVNFATLTDLALCDSGVDYFLFSQAVSDLVANGHLSFFEGVYAATAKGIENSSALESGLPSVVRGRCDRALAKLNADLRRAAQVTADLTQLEDHTMVTLGLSDARGPLLRLELAAPSQELGQDIARRFQAQPEELFNRILALLLEEKKEEATT